MAKKIGDGKLKLTKENLMMVEKLAGLGLSRDEIATYLGRSPRTIRRYMEDNEDLAEAYEKGRVKAHAKVANTAYDMATSGNSAQMTQFWLKARAGWRDHQSIELDAKVETTNNDVQKAAERIANVFSKVRDVTPVEPKSIREDDTRDGAEQADMLSSLDAGDVDVSDSGKID